MSTFKFWLKVSGLSLFLILLLAGKDIAKKFQQLYLGVDIILLCLLLIRIKMY